MLRKVLLCIQPQILGPRQRGISSRRTLSMLWILHTAPTCPSPPLQSLPAGGATTLCSRHPRWPACDPLRYIPPSPASDRYAPWRWLSRRFRSLQHPLLLAGLPSPDCPQLDPPGLIPTDAQNLRCALHITGHKQINRQTVKQHRKAGVGLCPGDPRLTYPMGRAGNPGNPSMQIGLKLTAVQMTPNPLLRMIPRHPLIITFRAPKANPGRVSAQTSTRRSWIFSSTRSTVQGSNNPNRCRYSSVSRIGLLLLKEPYIP